LNIFTFCRYIDNFSPWEDTWYRQKKGVEVTAIAELRAFDGILLSTPERRIIYSRRTTWEERRQLPAVTSDGEVEATKPVIGE
jgi:hypothetical protein